MYNDETRMELFTVEMVVKFRRIDVVRVYTAVTMLLKTTTGSTSLDTWNKRGKAEF